MTIAILLIYFQTMQFCYINNLPPICEEAILDCRFDGESKAWCENEYLENGLWYEI